MPGVVGGSIEAWHSAAKEPQSSAILTNLHLDTLQRWSHLGSMNKQAELILALKSSEAALRRFGVQHLAIFGSRARGDNYSDSDLDVLIDFVPNTAGADSISAGRAELAVSGTISNITGFDVSVVVRNRMPKALAGRIGADLIQVF